MPRNVTKVPKGEKIVVWPELEQLIPALTDEEFRQLRENIIEAGECREPLTVWNPPGTKEYVIVDGHNRWKVIQEFYDSEEPIAFSYYPQIFDSIDEIKEWMIKNQLGRRNLPAYVKTELALRLKSTIAARAKEQQARKPSSSVWENSPKQKPIKTREEIATIAGVSSNTVSKVEKLVKEAPEEVKEQLRSGKISINKAYTTICEKNPTVRVTPMDVTIHGPDKQEVKSVEVNIVQTEAKQGYSKWLQEKDKLAEEHMKNLLMAANLYKRLSEVEVEAREGSDGLFDDMGDNIVKAMWFFSTEYKVPRGKIEITRGANDYWNAQIGE